MSDETTRDPASLRAERLRSPVERSALVVVWSREEPERVGEVLFPPTRGAALVGRGAARADDVHPRAGWLRQRPGVNEPTAPLRSAAISRAQLVLERRDEGIHVTCIGRCPTYLDGVPIERGVLLPGSVLELEEQLVLYCARRPVAMPAARAWPGDARFPFGAPDPHGMVGESPAVWALREELAFAAARPLHVLLHGPTGTGKELAARTIHALSGSARPLASRNAATVPPGLIDAELFGNVKDYPNPGMRERAGLIGSADGSTLFLDELGELPESLQAHLLRVLDAGGEYQRLGEDRVRHSRFRLVAATNRDPAALKHDLLARLTLRVALPPLSARREDLPLLAQQLVREAARTDPHLEASFVERSAQGEHVRLAPELIAMLMRHPFEHGVRELAGLLWRCIRQSTGRWITLPADVESELAREAPAKVAADEVGPDEIARALAEAGGVVASAARALGLKNRHVLHRLMKKHGIDRPE